MPEYQVTDLTFGLGLQSGSTRTKRINNHRQEIALQGWRLAHVDHSGFELPMTWRFFWEMEARRPGTPGQD